MTNHQRRWTGQKRSTTAAGRITHSANSMTSTGAPPQTMPTTAETPLCRVATTTRPDPHLKIQQPSKPLPPPEPPPPQPRRPRPGTATGNHVRQRAANHHPSGLTLPRLKSQPRQGTRGGTAPGLEGTLIRDKKSLVFFIKAQSGWPNRSNLDTCNFFTK